jgi:5-methylcytosine-specific restriction endonuclease McrA
MAKNNPNKPYGNQRWRNARAVFLSRHPLCAHCAQVGVDTMATVVDHIVPHNGDPKLMWDVENWQTLCPKCHGAKRSAEEIGYSQACGIDGYPIDANHIFNKRR